MSRSILFVVAALVTVSASAVQVSASVNAARCGLNNGSAWATASGGLPPYSFVWDNGPNTQGNYNLAPGDYTVTVTDGLSNTDQVTVTVIAVNELANSLSLGQPDCANSCSGVGIIDVAGLGGTAPYTYSINGPNLMENGSVTEVHGLCADVPQLLTVTDATGCAVDLELIAYGMWPVFDEPVAITPECEGNANGTIMMGSMADYIAYQVDAMGGGFSELFEFGIGEPFLITGLPAGEYSVQPMIYNGWTWVYPYCHFGSTVTVPLLNAPCGSVAGTVYNDADQDCSQGPQDIGLPYRVLTIEPGPHYAITDMNGDYFAPVPTGSFTIAQPLVDETQLCPAQIPVPFTVDMVAPDAVVDLADSSLVQHDLHVNLWGNQARPGFSHLLNGHVQNASAYPSGVVTVTLNYDPLLVPSSMVPAPSDAGAGYVQWTFNGIEGYGMRGLEARFNVPADISLLGTILNATLTETNTAAESDDLNDSDAWTTEIVGSYDPNDKVARTSSSLSDSQYFLNEDDYIDYTIRFQNTGTATAQTVVVRDTLEADLDVVSLMLLGASHPFTPAFEEGRVLAFTFADINLPDSGANEAASHGSIHFRIKPRADITLGEVISNTAGIYFDFNPPVITAPSELIVEASTAVALVPDDLPGLHVFPNPTDGSLRILVDDVRHRAYSVDILAMDGRVVQRENTYLRGEALDVSGLTAGSYVLRLCDADGGTRQARFTKR